MRSLLSFLILSLLIPATLLTQTKSDREEGPIRIGVMLPLSGPNAGEDIDTYNGIRIAVDAANRKGGISGTRIEITTSDSESSSNWIRGVIDAFGKLAEARVSVVLSTLNWRGYAVERSADSIGVPLISTTIIGSIGLPGKARSRNLFHVCYERSVDAIAMARFARDSLHLKKVAIMNGEAEGAFGSSFIEQGGSIVMARSMRYGSEEEMLSILHEIAGTDAEAIYLPDDHHIVGLIAWMARSIGIGIPILGNDEWDSPDLMPVPGIVDVLEGSYFPTHFSIYDPTPAVRDFVRVYTERFGVAPTSNAALGHDAALLVIAAIRKAGSSDPKAVREALVGITIEGVTGPITIGTDRKTIKPVVIQRIEKGEFRFVKRMGIGEM